MTFGFKKTALIANSMRYEINDKTAKFYLDKPKRVAEAVRTQSFADTALTEQQIVPLLDCLLRKFRGQSISSQEFVTTGFLRPLFAYFKTTGSAWPTTTIEWQIFAMQFFQFYLTDTGWSSATPSFRMKNWQQLIGGLLECLKNDEIISRDVAIPRIALKKIQCAAKDKPMLGQPQVNLVDIRAKPKKLLVDINFGLSDADYLDEVERKCRKLVSVIRDVCLAHWSGLMKDFETGRQLAAQVTDDDIVKAIESDQYRGPPPKNGGDRPFLTSPTLSDGHNWALALIRFGIARGTDIGCVSVNSLRASLFFPKSLFTSTKATTSYTALDSLTTLTKHQWQVLPLPARFYRFAGLLSNLDAAAACCLLTIEHPEFTSESLQSARLLDVRGKPYLLLTDSSQHSILTLDKPRAGKRKSVVLTSLAQKLITDILERTRSVRDVLKRAGDKTWRFLFLGVTQRNNANGLLGLVEGKPIYLTGGARTIGLTALYQSLSENDLTKGKFDYRRLRNTMGIIRWFETGSILEMSRKLGNSRKVALEHYLPPALLHAWNTRIIRRFQNTLIALAAHDEDYLLEVTDFSSMADLQQFIAQLIVEYPSKTSPLADEVQERLGSEQKREAASLVLMPGLLNIQLAPNSLSLLYAYRDLALKTLSPDELDRVDVLSGFSPRNFTDMATMLIHAAESKEIHQSLRESLDLPLLKRVHQEALARKIGLDAQFTKLAIKHCWVKSL